MRTAIAPSFNGEQFFSILENGDASTVSFKAEVKGVSPAFRIG